MLNGTPRATCKLVSYTRKRMDAKQTITEIEWLERIFAEPDARPLRASDLAAANRRHDEKPRTALASGCGSDTAYAAEPCFDWAK